MRMLKVAVLYSGRFYGNLSQKWYDNHLQYLVRPLDASVFITMDPDNWCHAPDEARTALSEKRWEDAEAIFQAEVRRAFENRPNVFARLKVSLHNKSFVSSTVLKRMYSHAATRVSLPYSNFWYSLLRRWYMQFLHYADAEELRLEHGPHDVVIRARLDVVFSALCVLPEREELLDRRRVFAIGYFGKMSYPGPPMLDLMSEECDSSGENVSATAAEKMRRRNISIHDHKHVPCQRLWRDYLFVGNAASMEPLAQMAERTFNFSRSGRMSLLFDNTTRCFGLCAEEQTVLHLQRSGVELAPLSWDWALQRIHHNLHRTPANPNSIVCNSGAGQRIGR